MSDRRQNNIVWSTDNARVIRRVFCNDIYTIAGKTIEVDTSVLGRHFSHISSLDLARDACEDLQFSPLCQWSGHVRKARLFTV